MTPKPAPKAAPPEKKWRQVGGDTDGEFIKWDTPGSELEGIWVGMHDGKAMADGKVGQIGVIENSDGKFAFSCTTVLRDRLNQCATGSEIKVQYLGKARSKTGTEYKSFAVWINDAAESTDFSPGPDDDIPF